MATADLQLSIVPANHAGCDDLQVLFGDRGSASRCQCQRYRLQPKESFGNTPVEERIHRLRDQTDCENVGSGKTSGLVAYLDGEPVGWCAVEPRTAYVGLLRSNRVPWTGRDEDKRDDSVWAITCLFARAKFRRRGVSQALVHAAVEYARQQGARAIEAYPVTTTNVIEEELHPGTFNTYVDAGFTEVTRPTLRRAVVRIDY